MDEMIDVSTGEVAVGTGKAILRSIAIGSCIVAAAYDSRSRIGALAHIMLPGRAPENYGEKTKYAADGIDEMLRQMRETGARDCDVEACLVGAANVLKKDDDTVCQENIQSTTQLLAERNIPVRATVLGGTQRKAVSMDVERGTIDYTEGDGPGQVLWQADGKV